MIRRPRRSFIDRPLSIARIGGLITSRFGRRHQLPSELGPQLRQIRNRDLAARTRARVEAVNADRSDPTPSGLSLSACDIDTGAPSSITTRFIVLSEGRSGSTLLVDELHRRWTEILCQRECFSASQRASATSFEDLARRTFCESRDETIVGCKIFSEQISDSELSALLQLDGMRVVILRRRNQLRRFVSKQIAKKTKHWHQNRLRVGATAPPVEERRIHIDLTQFIREITVSELGFDRFERLTEGLPRFAVTYEELSSDLDGSLRRVASFLGAGEPAHEAPPVLTRQNPEPLRSLIENFDELSDFLQDVGLQELLTMGEEQGSNDGVTSADAPFGWGECWWPDTSQRLLLRALIGPEESFEENWRASFASDRNWTGAPDLDRLYPAIHQRIRRTNLVPPTLLDYRAESIRNSARKVRLLDALREVTAALAAEDLEVTLIGSTALLALHPEADSHTFRCLAMSRLDLVPGIEDFARVHAAIRRLGWSVNTAATSEPTTSPDPFVRMRREDLELRLHRSVLRAPGADELVAELHAGRIPADDLGRTTMLLAPTDLLVAIIVDGVMSGTEGSIEWILDVQRLLVDDGADLDRERFLALTRTHGLQVPVTATMQLLDDLDRDLVPPAFLGDLSIPGPISSDRSDGVPSIATRFIILSEPRSGSTLMVRELRRRWPEIRSKGEMFKASRRADAKDFEELLRATFLEETGTPIVGCKIFMDHVSPNELATLLSLDGMRIVTLQRRNLLRRLVSLQIATRTSIWAQRSGSAPENELSVEARRLTIDTASLGRAIQQSFTGFLQRNRMISDLPSIHVWYEDLAADLDGELRRVASFLGAGEPTRESPPLLTRQNPEPLPELIVNFEQVSTCLRELDLGEFLTEDARRVAGSSGAPAREEIGVSSWPTTDQQVLLRALLGPEDSFEAAWTTWTRSTDAWSRVAAMDMLAPAIHHRLRVTELRSSPILDLRAETVRRTAVKVRLLDELEEILAGTSAAEEDLVLLGSTALATRSTDRGSTGSSTVTMSGLDLTTSTGQLDALITRLQPLGWSVVPSRAASTAIMRRNDLELRLHRAVMRAATTDALNEDLRSGLVRSTVPGGTAFVLAPAELLFSILLDGMLTRPAGSITWILDAHHLITTADDLDWSRIVELSVRHQCGAPVAAALELLDTLGDDPGRPEFHRILAMIPVNERQRAAFDDAMRLP